MSYRIRRSFKLAPGVRINLSKSGLSTSLGIRGASVNIGKRGISRTLGIPGTGIYSREYLKGNRTSSSSASYTYLRSSVSISDDGELEFLGTDGVPLPAAQITAVKRQNGPAIRQLMQDKCDEINAYVEALGAIHLYTPSPDTKPVYEPVLFPEPEPSPPKLKRVGLLAMTFKSVRKKTETLNAQRQAEFEAAHKEWHEGLLRHGESEQKRRHLIEIGIYTDPQAMETYVEESLQGIEWPRETSVTMDLMDKGRALYLDTDLPEIEDLPRKTATVPQRGYKLTVKDISESNLRKQYANHIHGIGFRLIGESFAALPILEEIVVSAFTQRPDSSTGKTVDQYLYSIRVNRQDWRAIDFAKLAAVDAVEALARFEIRRSMTKTGIFKPIEPFQPSSS